MLYSICTPTIGVGAGAVNDDFFLHRDQWLRQGIAVTSAAMTEKNENRVVYTYLAIWFVAQLTTIGVSWGLGFFSAVLIIVAPILIAASLGNAITRRS